MVAVPSTPGCGPPATRSELTTSGSTMTVSAEDFKRLVVDGCRYKPNVLETASEQITNCATLFWCQKKPGDPQVCCTRSGPGLAVPSIRAPYFLQFEPCLDALSLQSDDTSSKSTVRRYTFDIDYLFRYTPTLLESRNVLGGKVAAWKVLPPRNVYINEHTRIYIYICIYIYMCIYICIYI